MQVPRLSGGSLWGGWTPAAAYRSKRLLPGARVLPAQRLYGQMRDFLLVYGKEKVYGSIL